MKNKTLLLVAFGGMVILNLVTLGVLWFNFGHGHVPGSGIGPGPGPGHMGPPPRGPKDFISQELTFSPEQNEAFEQLRKEHFGQVREIEREIGETRELLMKKYAIDNGEAEAKPLIEKMTALRGEMETATFQHFQQVRNLCNEAQKATFDSIIGEVMTRLSGKPPPHQPTRRRKESLP
jgi:hypothetical protein